jgi:hypothetical protein
MALRRKAKLAVWFAEIAAMMACRGMGAVNPDKLPGMKKGGSVSKVNEAGNYTKPGLRERLFSQIKGQATHGTKAGQWSARKAQLLAKKYKSAGGGYRD